MDERLEKSMDLGLRPLLLGAALGLLVGLAATLWTFLVRDGFNEDEFFQVTFLNERFPEFFALFIRLDQHPPFHFLQLKPWGAISSADGWLLFNSVAWHLVSCVVIWAVGRAWLGMAAGLLASALYALTPQVVVASTTLRFYAMMPALAVLAWWLHVQLLSRADHRARFWWVLVGVQIALGYSHAIGFYFVFWIALAAAVQQWFAVGAQAPWRRWLLMQASVIAALLPLMLMTAARAMMARGSEAIGGNYDPGSLIDHIGAMTSGWGMQWYWARMAGVGVFLAAVLVGLWRPVTRWMSAILLIGPYALAWVIGMLLTPMYKTPVYSAMMIPFACLALAGGLVCVPDRWRAVPALALLAAMAVFIFPASSHLNRDASPYKLVVSELGRVVRPGDVVVVPKPFLYWAVMRYAVGPHWGSPLEVLPALNDSWRGLTQRLGEPLSRALKLIPRTNQIERGGITYVIGDDATDASNKALRVWLVEQPRYPMPIKLSAGFVDKGRVYRLGVGEATEIHLYER